MLEACGPIMSITRENGRNGICRATFGAAPKENEINGVLFKVLDKASSPKGQVGADDGDENGAKGASGLLVSRANLNKALDDEVQEKESPLITKGGN